MERLTRLEPNGEYTWVEQRRDEYGSDWVNVRVSSPQSSHFGHFEDLLDQYNIPDLPILETLLKANAEKDVLGPMGQRIAAWNPKEKDIWAVYAEADREAKAALDKEKSNE